MLLLLACGTPAGANDAGGGDGDAGGGGVDGAVLDAGADAGSIDAYVAPAQLTVLVTDGDAPQAGAAVIWLDAAGAMLGETTTGADGRAALDLPEGGTVVAIPAAPSGPLQTFVWLGAQPGDELRVVRRGTPAETTVATEVRVPPVAGGVRWQIDTECGVGVGTTSRGSVALRDDCTRSDVVVTHYDGASEPIGTTVALDHAITPGSALDLSALTPLPSTSATLALVGITADVTYADLSVNAWFGSVRSPAGIQADASSPTGPLTAAGMLPTLGASGRLVTLAQVSERGGRLYVERHGAALSDVDLAASQMPVLTALTYDARGRRITLASAGTGPVAVDGTYVRLMADGAGGRPLVWHVLAGDTDTIRLPALPTAHADAELPLDATVAYAAYRLAAPSSPDEVRQRAFTLASPSDLLVGDGDLVYSLLVSAH